MVNVIMIRNRMKQLGMTQKVLAPLLGVSRNTLSSRLKGRSSFRMKEIDRLCDVLEIWDPIEKSLIFFR